ncbi:MAG: diguanylate cyclase, partial [Acidobacteriia bacterium]|nr:diguanylate cyclase [Terriglobia bacterium]
MGTTLGQLPPIFILPTLTSFILLVFILQRLHHRRNEEKRNQAQLLRFSNLQLLITAISSTPDMKKLVDQALDGILQALGLDQGFALLHIPGTNGADYSAARGFSEQAQEQLSKGALRDYLFSSGDRWGSLMVFPDLLSPDLVAAWHRDPVFPQFREVITAEGLRTLLVLGLQTRDRPYGLLVVGSRQVKTFRPNELRLTMAIGNQTSVALENRALQLAGERHGEELRALHRVVEALSATFDLEMQLQILQHELKGVLGASEFSLVLQESRDGRPEAVSALDEGAPGPARRRTPDALSAYVLSTRAPLLIVRDFLNTARRLGISPIDPRILCWAGVPIQFSDGSMGVLAVTDYQREGALDDRRFELLKVLAGEVAVAIENARLFQQEQRRARHLALLNELARRTMAVLDPKELLPSICPELRSAFGYELVRVETIDRNRDELVVEAQGGYAPTLLGKRRKRGEGLAGFAIESGEPVLANDVTRDERYVPFHSGVRSALMVPLKYRSEVLGVLSIESLRSDSFSQQDVLTICTLTDQLAIALKNAQAYQVAQEQAITDSLTGLKTHRYFMESLDAEWRRSPRSGRHFSLIMMDLDGFKHVNDRHGHLEGDRVLKTVAELLEARCRQSNVVARLGGDQFAILMAETSTEQAQILAERLRSSFAADSYLASRGVTASFGIATFPMHGVTADEIVHVAESGVYLAKHERGNSVRVASSSQDSPDAAWEQQLLQAYLGVAVKRMFSTGPEVFNQYLSRFEAATRDTQGENPSLMDTVTALAFTIDEIASLFRDHYAISLSDEDIRSLAAETEGWAIALQLYGQGLKSGAVSPAGRGPLPPGTGAEGLFDYLAQEVFEQLSPDVRQFLQVTAILRELNASICNQLRGQNDSDQYLRYLYENGLFLVDLGGESIRYHHLFREFILRRLPDAERSELNRKAAVLQLERKNEEDAIYHFLRA